MLKLRLLTGPRAGRQLRVSDTKPVSIGRRKGRLRLHDSRVSKNHAEIYCANNVWVLRDLDSANGTYVNRRRAEGLVELEPGDHVQMGRVLMKVVRCDMIGMDTQPFDPDASLEDSVAASAFSGPEASGFDDDIDLDELFSDTKQRDSSRDEPEADVPEDSVETADEVDDADDVTPEPISVAFDQPVDDDDSFFSDLGEATDTTGGDAVKVKDDPSSLNEDDDQSQSGINEPIEAASDEAFEFDTEDEQADASEAPDPFLSDESEPTEGDTADLISLDDESGMGPRNAGTTLLTAVHDDGTPIDEPEKSDANAQQLNEQGDADDEDDGEPPALVGLALGHAPPQQPALIDEDDDVQDEATQDADAGVETAESDTHVAEPVGPVDDLAPSDDLDRGIEFEIDEPERVEEVAEVEQIQEPEAIDELQGLDEPDLPDETKQSPIALDLPPGIEAPPDSTVEEAPDDEPEAVDDEIADEAPENALALSSVDEDIPSLDGQDQDTDFDIDAAFDALSAGLDDSMSGLPAIDEEVSEQPQDDSLKPAEQPVDSTTDSLAGTQLDVSFIQDALARLEKDQLEDDETASGDPSHKASAAPAPPAVAPPAQPDVSYSQSPPPGLTSSDMNPMSVNPPAEPFRSHSPKRTGGGTGRWFFTLLLFLGIGGVGGWFINQNYDRFIGGRTTPAAADATPPIKPSPLNNPPATGPAQQDKPIQTPVLPDANANNTPQERIGPNPFSSGPPVIGGDALQGLLRDSNDSRPLDPPNEGTPDTVTGSDPLRDPNLPTIGSTNPNTQDPDQSAGPDEQPPAVTNPKPARIVFLVDASGSLVDSLPQMVVWLNEALLTIKPDEQFAIYFFKSDKPIAIKPAGMLKPSRQLLGQIAENWLNAERMPVFPSGRSNPAKALSQALTLEPTDIYLLSDDSFAFNQGDTTASEALDLVKQAIGDKDVRVHGVQFFYRSQESILETLANQYDGTYEFVRESVVPNADPIDLLEELGGE